MTLRYSHLSPRLQLETGASTWAAFERPGTSRKIPTETRKTRNRSVSAGTFSIAQKRRVEVAPRDVTSPGTSCNLCSPRATPQSSTPRGSAFGTTGWSLDGDATGEKTPSRPDLWLETRCRNDAEACALESAGGLLTGIVGCNRCHANRPGRAAIPYKQVDANGLSSEPVWVSFRWQGRLSL